jgi:hypothetical protein
MSKLLIEPREETAMQMFKDFPELAGHPWYIQLLVRALPWILGAIIGTVLAFILVGCEVAPTNAALESRIDLLERQLDESKKRECQKAKVIDTQPAWKTTCEEYRKNYDRMMKYDIDLWHHSDTCQNVPEGEEKPLICPSRDTYMAIAHLHQVLDNVFCGELPEDFYGERYRER